METKAKSAARMAKTEAPDLPKGKFVGAVVNSAKILRFLRTTAGPATATQITRAVQMNPNTCFNLAQDHQ